LFVLTAVILTGQCIITCCRTYRPEKKIPIASFEVEGYELFSLSGFPQREVVSSLRPVDDM
jgi:hypothetical protein